MNESSGYHNKEGNLLYKIKGPTSTKSQNARKMIL